MAEPTKNPVPPKGSSGGTGLSRKVKGVPLYVWYGGGAGVVALGLILYRKYKAGQAGSTTTVPTDNTATGQYPPFFGGGGDSGGGGGGVAPAPGPTPDTTPVGLNPGGLIGTFPVSTTPTPAPVPSAPVTTAVPYNSAQLVTNPIAGDTSTVVQGTIQGQPFTYGGSPTEAQNIIGQLSPQPQMTLPPASGVGSNYTTPEGQSFVYG